MAPHPTEQAELIEEFEDGARLQERAKIEETGDRILGAIAREEVARRERGNSRSKL